MISGEIFGPLGVPQYKDYITDIARSGRMMLKTVDGLLEQEMVKDIVKEGREYRSIIELAPDLMSICRDGVIEMINPAGASMLKVWPVEKLEGRSLADFIHPDYRQLVEEGMEALAEEGQKVPCKFLDAKQRVIDVEMSAIPYHLRGERQAVMLVARDVTNIKKANEAVVSREQRLRQIMDTVADAIISCDEDGIVESFNTSAEGIFGYSADEIVGQSIGLLMPPQLSDDPMTTMKRAAKLTRDGAGLIEEDYQARRKDGSNRRFREPTRTAPMRPFFLSTSISLNGSTTPWGMPLATECFKLPANECATAFERAIRLRVLAPMNSPLFWRT